MKKCEKMKEVKLICILFANTQTKIYTYYYMHSYIISKTNSTYGCLSSTASYLQHQEALELGYKRALFWESLGGTKMT